MEPFEIMISESQERMLCVVEPDRVAEVLAVCDKWEVNATAIGEVTDSGRLRVFDGDDLVGDLPVARAGRRVPGLRPRARRAGRPDLPGAAARRSTDALAPARRCSRCSASANLASRRWAFEQYDCLVGSRTVRRPEAGRRGRADARRAAAAHRRLDRRQRPPRGGRPVSRRGRGRARVLGQPRLRRRRAARPDQLPQLRQPREAAHRLAAHPRGGRASATRAARSACRSWAATSPSTTRAAEARSTRRRSSAWSASCPTRRAPAASASPQDGDAVALIAARLGAGADRLRAGQAARRGARRRAPARRPRRAARAARRRPPGRALRRAALGARRRRGRARGRAGRVLPGRRLGASVDLDGLAAVRRGPGRVRRLRPARGAGALRRRRAGARHGRRRRAARSRARSTCPLAELSARPRASGSPTSCR